MNEMHVSPDLDEIELLKIALLNQSEAELTKGNLRALRVRGNCWQRSRHTRRWGVRTSKLSTVTEGILGTGGLASLSSLRSVPFPGCPTYLYGAWQTCFIYFISLKYTFIVPIV